jgi:hypothetical protein
LRRRGAVTPHGVVMLADPEGELTESGARRGTTSSASCSAVHCTGRAGHLLPDRSDFVRYRADSGVRLVRRIRAAIRELVCDSLRDGREHAADFGTPVDRLEGRG